MSPVFDDQPGASPSSSSMVLPVLIELGPLLEDIGLVWGAGEFVIALDQKPVFALLAAACRASSPGASVR